MYFVFIKKMFITINILKDIIFNTIYSIKIELKTYKY